MDCFTTTDTIFTIRPQKPLLTQDITSRYQRNGLESFNLITTSHSLSPKELKVPKGKSPALVRGIRVFPKGTRSVCTLSDACPLKVSLPTTIYINLQFIELIFSNILKSLLFYNIIAQWSEFTILLSY